MDVAKRSEQFLPESAEIAYNLLTGYGFARRYVEGKSVANISWDDVGQGTHLLAETAGFAVGLTTSVRALEAAREFYFAPNVHYGRPVLPELPYAAKHFDVVIALEVIEHLERSEELVEEIARVLKEDGVLIVSTRDRQVSNERNDSGPEHGQELYVPEFRELLERRFGSVELFRHGAVAGGLIIKENGTVAEALVESARYVQTKPSLGDVPPPTDLVLAVCGNSQAPDRGEERPYLLLDRDRLLLDESADNSEDIELLREEIQRMQDTEVQAFQDTMRVRNTEIASLKAGQARSEAQLEQLTSQLQTQERQLQARKRQLQEIHNSRAWRLIERYRRLRSRLQWPIERFRRLRASVSPSKKS